MSTNLILKVKLVPRSSCSGFVSYMDDGFCKIRVKAPPVDGKANRELIRWVAGEFGVSSDGVTISSGASSRRKVLKILAPTLRPDWFNG